MRKRSPTPVAASTPKPKDHSDDRQFVTALARGLQVLRAFKPSDIDGLSNRELAERTELPNSTISRLTYTMLQLGYLTYDQRSGRYRMGTAVLGLGYACLGGIKVKALAQPLMQHLADQCGDGVLVGLGGRDDQSMTYLACARSTGMISLQLDVGSRISLLRSAMGRAYLAGTDPSERLQILQHARANTADDEWEVLRAGIADAAQQIENRGFYVNYGGWKSDVHAVSVPFRTRNGVDPLLVFNLGGPGYLLSPERLENDLGPRLRAMVSKLAETAG